MSLTQVLSTSITGLKTTQDALTLVAANVANAQTPGYVRKTLSQVETAAGSVGVSVRSSGINRVLDQYVQKQLQIETSGASYADLQATFYSRLQGIYGTPGSATSLETTFNNFTTAVQGLTTNPADYSAQTGVINAAQILAGQLNNLTEQVQGLRSDTEQGLADAANTANNALNQIASINRQLAASSVNDATEASLQDQRDNYINQLSQLLDVRVIPGDHNQVSVFTGSGIQLVGAQASQLSFNLQGTVNANAQYDPDPNKSGVGSLQLVLPTGGKYDLIANHAIKSGQIAALLDLRDNVLTQAQAQLDGFAAALSQSLSGQQVAGVPATVSPKTGFDVDVSGVQPGDSVSFTYTDSGTGAQHHITVVRVEDPSALPLSNNATTDPNDEVVGVSFSGGPSAVAAALNAKFGSKIQFSTSGASLRILNDAPAGTTSINSASAQITQTSLSGGTLSLPIFTDADKPYSGVITSSGSQLVGFAGRISVNSGLVADPGKLVAYQSGTLAADTTRPNFIYDQLVKSRQTYSPTTGVGTATAPYTGTIGSYLQQVLSQQGAAASNAANIKQGQDVVLNSLQQRFNDSSTVNIDQEMANLLNLQNAYSANARILTSVKEMFDALLQAV